MDLDDNEEAKNSKKETDLNPSSSLLSNPVSISSTSVSPELESTSPIIASSRIKPMSPTLSCSSVLAASDSRSSSSIRSTSSRASSSLVLPSKSSLAQSIETPEKEFSQEHKSSKSNLSISQPEKNEESIHNEFLLSNQIENSSIFGCKKKNNLDPEFESLCKEKGNHCVIQLDDFKKSRSGSLVSTLSFSLKQDSYLKVN